MTEVKNKNPRRKRTGYFISFIDRLRGKPARTATQGERTPAPLENPHAKCPSRQAAGKSSDYIFSNAVSSDNSCALMLENSSMEPRFEKGTIIIVDFNEKPHHKDFVVAKIKKYNEHVFRQIEITKTEKKLTALNRKMYNDIVVADDVIICGVVIQTICNYKRD